MFLKYDSVSLVSFMIILNVNNAHKHISKHKCIKVTAVVVPPTWKTCSLMLDQLLV